MHYYPTILPHVNKSKLERYKKYSSPTTMLYSNEGMFQVKSGKLYQVHFKDDENSVQKILESVRLSVIIVILLGLLKQTSL